MIIDFSSNHLLLIDLNSARFIHGSLAISSISVWLLLLALLCYCCCY